MRHLLANLGILSVFGLTAVACGAANGGDDSESSSAAATKETPVLMGIDSSAQVGFQSATGLKAEVIRVYLNQGKAIPSSTTEAGLDAYYEAGQAVVYSMKVDDSPDSEATNKENLAALAKDIVSQGHADKTWLVLHHEPYPELTGEAFQKMYATYAPTIREAGVRCGVIYQTYPLYHGQPDYAADYTGGILADVDFIGIDVYPGGMPGEYTGDILTDISPFSTYAKDNGKRFQIDEVAVDDTVSGTKEQQAAWLGGLAELGSDIDVLMYFEGASGAFPNLNIQNNADAVTEWKDLWKTLTTR